MKKKQLISAYKELISPCIVSKTGKVGVIKSLYHCPDLLADHYCNITIPRVCNYEICEDFVCCPINPHRLNQVCKLYDDPRFVISYRVQNQFPCELERAGYRRNQQQRFGVFNFNYYYENEPTPQKSCQFDVCEDNNCYPLSRKTTLTTYNSAAYKYTEVVGGRCLERTTNQPGLCRYVAQCPQSQGKDYTICGYDHCSKIVCCPEPNYSRLKVSGQYCANYRRHIYDRVKPILHLENPSVSKCNAVSPAGGVKAAPKEFPQMAALGYESKPNQITWDCGGTIISNRYVLTAAHCLTDDTLGDVKHVRLGALNLVKKFLACPEDFLVEKRIPHKDYRRRFVYNDIGLIRVNRNIIFNSLMLPACLPQTRYVPRYDLIATGWGFISGEKIEKTDHLLKIKINYYNNTECNELYRNSLSRHFRDGLREETHICAGSRRTVQDTCPGDSGGPLFADNDYYKMRTVVGVTSFGKTCGQINSPGIYTRVYPFVKWIEEEVWGKK